MIDCFLTIKYARKHEGFLSMKVGMNGDFVDNKTSEEQLLWHEGEGEPATGSGQKWGRKANGWSGKGTKLAKYTGY
jgi:hypothetical protein